MEDENRVNEAPASNKKKKHYGIGFFFAILSLVLVVLGLAASAGLITASLLDVVERASNDLEVAGYLEKVPQIKEIAEQIKDIQFVQTLIDVLANQVFRWICLAASAAIVVVVFILTAIAKRNGFFVLSLIARIINGILIFVLAVACCAVVLNCCYEGAKEFVLDIVSFFMAK